MNKTAIAKKEMRKSVSLYLFYSAGVVLVMESGLHFGHGLTWQLEFQADLLNSRLIGESGVQ